LQSTDARRLKNRQSAHVGPETDGLQSVAGAKHADDSGPVDHTVGFDTLGPKQSRNDVSGLVRFKTEFRIGMNISTNIDQLRLIAAHPFQGGLGGC
jgi:hypothetical protein